MYTKCYQKVRRLMRLKNQYLLSHAKAYTFLGEYKTTINVYK